MAAAASSSSASTSSSSSSQKTYDVFLSFRGEDIRDNFLSHLHKSLSDAKILTFIDNNLERGQEISQSLLDAIEASRISLVIFSENYATSRWCLNELVKILECHDRHGQIVIPVFYRVDPSDVRKQTGSYDTAFTRDEQPISLDMVKTWKDALKKAANLSGWDSRVERSEADLIKKIVSDAWKKLEPVPSSHSSVLVGIDSKVVKILSLLHLESPDVRILGIWGAGGIGKTTMARKISECIDDNFEERYFLQDAKEALKQPVLIPGGHGGLPIILKERSSSKTSLDPAFLGERTHLKKVLAILDDVDDSTTLRDLLMEKGASFGPGSRIILTSRDKQALKVVADDFYEVEKLNHADALELFNLHAFETHRPSEFVLLSEKVVEYADGNPLALKVLGFALCGKRKDAWESALEDLSLSSGETLDVLRVSYKGLNSVQKKIFLHVAIVLEGMDKQLVKQILSSCFGKVQSFLMDRLVEKALLAENDNKFEMHNLLRELAKKIISEDSRNETGILCDPDKIKRMLLGKKGTELIEVISLDLSKIQELALDCDAFMGMYGLKVLQVYSSVGSTKAIVHLPACGLKFISDELRYLRWDGYPSKGLPVRFCAENLVSLELRESKLKELWAGVQNVVNLKEIDLYRSTRLIALPDLSKALHLDKIVLRYCGSLVELTSSIQCLRKLEVLDLSDCRSLRKLPLRLDSPVLRELHLLGSGKVKRCPKTSSGNLKVFSFEGAGIEELPQSSLNKMEKLCLQYCPNITKFPEVSENIRGLELLGTGIKEIPSSIEFCTSLTHLRMDGCEELLSIPTGVCKLKSLELLSLRGCSKLESFPEIQEPMKRLWQLDLSFCKNLKSLPNSFHNLKSLKYPYLDGTANKELPSSTGIRPRLEDLRIDGGEIGVEECQQLPLLTVLSLTGCNLMEIPNSICSLKQRLFSLDLSENNFKILPPNLHQLSGLKFLKLNKCRRLRSLPELPGSLRRLEANDCESLETISTGGTKLLPELLLVNCRKLDQGVRDELVDETLTRYRHIKREREKWEVGHPTCSTLLPGSEIPEWFGGYRGKGSSITIKLPSTINCGGYYRIAVCFVFASSSASAVLPSLKPKFAASTPLRLSDYPGMYGMPRLDLSFSTSRFFLIESDHVLMWQSRIYVSSSDAGKDVSVAWTSFRDHVKPPGRMKVKKWGVQIHMT